MKCDHKFIDGNHCLKCGWIPPTDTEKEPNSNSEKRGRPVSPYKRGEKLIGIAGMVALSEADLYVVDGDTIRKLQTLTQASKHERTTPR